MRAFRRRLGKVLLSFHPEEAAGLIGLPARLRDALLDEEEGNRLRERLLPSASDDARVAAEYRALLGDTLREEKLSRIEDFERTLKSARLEGDEVEVELTGEDQEMWLGFLNDMRLLIGTLIDVDEDWEPEEDMREDEALYLYLTGLQGVFLRLLD